MRKKEKPTQPTLTVVNGWERKNFIIKQGHKDDEISVEFVVKYKNHKTSNVDFEILEIDDDEENPVNFSGSSIGYVELCELKLLALKTCLTFLKTGALVLEPLEK
jgi:hypothetical protein